MTAKSCPEDNDYEQLGEKIPLSSVPPDSQILPNLCKICDPQFRSNSNVKKGLSKLFKVINKLNTLRFNETVKTGFVFL